VIGQVQSMLEAARLQAVRRLARLRADDEWCVDLLATARDKTPRQLAYALRTAVHAVDPEDAAARARARRQERRVSVEHQDEGMSWLNALLATPDVLAIKDLLDGLAREVTSSEDSRTMDQLRADVLRDLLLGHQHTRVRVHVYVTATAGTARSGRSARRSSRVRSHPRRHRARARPLSAPPPAQTIRHQDRDRHPVRRPAMDHTPRPHPR
jgi:hypothetical protein